MQVYKETRQNLQIGQEALSEVVLLYFTGKAIVPIYPNPHLTVFAVNGSVCLWTTWIHHALLTHSCTHPSTWADTLPSSLPSTYKVDANSLLSQHQFCAKWTSTEDAGSKAHAHYKQKRGEVGRMHTAIFVSARKGRQASNTLSLPTWCNVSTTQASSHDLELWQLFLFCLWQLLLPVAPEGEEGCHYWDPIRTCFQQVRRGMEQLMEWQVGEGGKQISWRLITVPRRVLLHTNSSSWLGLMVDSLLFSGAADRWFCCFFLDGKHFGKVAFLERKQKFFKLLNACVKHSFPLSSEPFTAKSKVQISPPLYFHGHE